MHYELRDDRGCLRWVTEWRSLAMYMASMYNWTPWLVSK